MLHQEVQVADGRRDREELAVVGGRLVVEDDRALEAEHVAVRRLPVRRQRGLRTREHSPAHALRGAVHVGGQHLQQRRLRRGHRQRVAVERADLVVHAIGDGRHHLLGAADGTARQPAAERLGQAHDVGRDAEQAGRPAPVDHQPGLHLVERQQHAVLASELAHALQIAGLRRDDAGVHHHRLDDHAGDLTAVLRRAHARARAGR